MNYKQDTTKLSVLVVAFLLVGGAFTFLPTFAYTTGGVRTGAVITPANNALPPTVQGDPYVVIQQTATGFSVNVTNPSSNQFAITSFTVVAPSGWTFSTLPTCGGSDLLNTVGAHSTGAVQCTATGSSGGIPPGFSEIENLGEITGPSSTASSPAVTGTFTTLVVDSSGSDESYAGNSFTEYSIASATISAITITPTSSTFTGSQFTAGGSALTITATLSSGQVGVPIAFSFSNANYPSSGFTSTLSPSLILSTGPTITSTWVPSNYATDATEITATIGNSAFSDSTGTVTTVAGAPSEVSFYFTVSGTTYSTDYLTSSVSVGGTTYAESPGTELSLSLADAYANPVTFSVSISAVTLTASGGEFYFAGSQTLASTLSCGSAANEFVCPTSGNAIQFPVLTHGDGDVYYVQSALYGATGTISGSITYSGTTYSGTSGNIVTSTFEGSLNSPGLVTTNSAGNQVSDVPGSTGALQVQAGSSIIIYDTLADQQQGVPITLSFCPGCAGVTAGYDSSISGFIPSEVLYTNSTGMVQYSVPSAPTTIQTNANLTSTTRPLTIETNNNLTSTESGLVTTGVGSLSTLVIDVVATANTGQNIQYSASGATDYVSIAYADSYGNLIPTADAPSNQIQISLSASSGGLLSATSVYIPGTDTSTNATLPVPGFGTIELTMPSSVGTTVTLTATAVVSGKSVTGTATIQTVSDAPTISITSPVAVSGVVYSKTLEVTFTGTANASIGLPNNDIATIGYKIGTGSWSSIETASLHNVTWSIPVILSQGLNTVTFNATDNESPAVTTVSSSITVLVDSSAPTFSGITLCSCGDAAHVNITAAEGDLNASSVQAWLNGTAVPASSITVSGTNNPGSSVTYEVTISNLLAGTWSVEVSASTLAGVTATTTGSVTATVSSSTNTISFPTPVPGMLSSYHDVSVSVTNNAGTSLTIVVFGVVHNSAGQTVEVTTSTVTLAAGQTSTAYLILNQPSGSYSVNVFAWSTSGISLSQSSTVTASY